MSLEITPEDWIHVDSTIRVQVSLSALGFDELQFFLLVEASGYELTDVCFSSCRQEVVDT